MTDAIQTKLGKIIQGEERRDATHVAVMPVVATGTLKPGQHVAFLGGGTVGPGAETIGVVDPFLKAPVEDVQRFWLFLYPDTITGLRHEWTHPIFDGDTKAASLAWIEAFARTMEMTGQRLLDAANRYVECGDWTYDNSERYKDADYSQLPTFWRHYEIVTGNTADVDKTDMPFTCSC